MVKPLLRGAFYIDESLLLGGGELLGGCCKVISSDYVSKTPFDLLLKTCGLVTAGQANQMEVTMHDMNEFVDVDEKYPAMGLFIMARKLFVEWDIAKLFG